MQGQHWLLVVESLLILDLLVVWLQMYLLKLLMMVELMIGDLYSLVVFNGD